METGSEANGADEAADNGEPNSKRAREEGDNSGEGKDDISKKQKVGESEKSVEEERLEKGSWVVCGEGTLATV